MNDATSRMAGYSAQIQAAQAANEVRSMMGQMGALQRVQGGVSMETRLARLEETKGDAGAAWQRAGDTINGTLLQVFQPILQTGADLLTVGVDRMQKMMEILGEWLPNLGVMESLHAEAEKIRARWESEDMNAAGPMFQFFGGVPDLELTDSAVQGANIERTGVAFDFLRGEELP